ncbi:MAG: hypothetical protein H7839_14530 [Magnetococcus sp. YQC-5]
MDDSFLVANRYSFSRLWMLVLPLLSGYCGLGYEVLFGRILGNHAGDQFVVSAAILITFLCGIGVGAALAHRLWRWLWAIELAIGLCGVAFALGGDLIHAALYAPPLVLGASLHTTILFLIALLAIPSLLIGCTLPLMAGYLEQALGGKNPFAHTYWLYNLGSGITVIFVEFVLVTHFGLRFTLLSLACVNIVTAIILWSFFPPERLAPPAVVVSKSISPLLMSSLILAGMASAIFQLIMIKLTEFVYGPFRESFALVLAVILLGLSMGAWLVQRFRLSFGAALIISLVGLCCLLEFFIPFTGIYANYFSWFADFGQSGTVFWKFFILFLLMGSTATGFGALIPALLTQHTHLAREAGRLLFISSLANAVGFVLMVFVLHGHLRYGEMIVYIAIMTLVAWGIQQLMLADKPKFALVNAQTAEPKHGIDILPPAPWFRCGTHSLICTLVSMFSLGIAVISFHYVSWKETLLFVGHRSYSDLSQLNKARSDLGQVESYTHGRDVLAIVWIDKRPFFMINGYISIPLDSASESLVGAYAAMHAPRINKALVLGVGSGKSAGAVARLFRHTDAVEINPAVLDQLSRMEPYNQNLSKVTNISYILDDAIHFANQCSQTYDLVLNTVTSPLYFSSSKLYTIDFLDALKKCFEKDTVYATWVDSRVGEQGIRIILKTLESRFKYAVLALIRRGYFLILASQDPLRVHHPDLVAQETVLSRYFAQSLNTRPEWIPYALLSARPFDYVAKQDIPLNTLDRPVLEFAMARPNSRGYGQFQVWLKSQMRLEDAQEVWNNTSTWNPSHLVSHNRALAGKSKYFHRWVALVNEQDDSKHPMP